MLYLLLQLTGCVVGNDVHIDKECTLNNCLVGDKYQVLSLSLSFPLNIMFSLSLSLSLSLVFVSLSL